MPTRDESILILDLTSTILRAGVGVHDLIRGPHVGLVTRLGRKSGTTGTAIEDYLVGSALFQAEAEQRQNPSAEAKFETVNPLRVDERTGFEVTDWVGLEAVFRHAIHSQLALPRPPVSHPTVLIVPPSLPPSTLDRLHLLLFERLLVPQLLISSRPFFAAGAAGVLSSLVLDIGYRGEGSEISVVHENMVLDAPGGLRLPFIDEGACDDWCALKILEAQEGGEEGSGGVVEAMEAAKGANLAPGDLAWGMRAIMDELKLRSLIGFESPLLEKTVVDPSATGAAPGGGEEEGTFDVAKVIVEGKVDALVGKKGKGKSKAPDEPEEGGEFVAVKNPFFVASPSTAAAEVDLTASLDPPPPPPNSTIKIGPKRHRYLEPLFFPRLIAELAPSASPAAAALGFGEYERFAGGAGRGQETDFAGVHEALGAVLARVEDHEVRREVGEAVVIVSSGRVASIKALGPTLTPLLLPFRFDLDSATLAALTADGAPPPPRGIRHAQTPEYFANFKEKKGEWGCYLGGCVMGKLLIGDPSKLFMTKADYVAHGPAHHRLLEALG